MKYPSTPIRWLRGAVAAPLVVPLFFGCAAPEDRPPPTSNSTSFSLTVGNPPTHLSLPHDNRPQQRAPSDAIHIVGSYQRVSSRNGLNTYRAKLPYRPRAMFFFQPLPGMGVTGPNGAVQYDRQKTKRANTWNFNAEYVYITKRGGPPKQGAYTITYPRASTREARLNYGFSGIESEQEFVQATIQVGPESRSGLLLPSPGAASWEITIPTSAELHFVPMLVAPEILDAPKSNGVTLSAHISSEGTDYTVWSEKIKLEKPTPRRINLSQFEGQQVTLTLQSDSDEDTTFDYAFFGDPVVTSRKQNPQRVFMIFVDTLRPDHMSLYGYGRDTTPNLKQFFSNGTVFENARSIAPWTLPSSRTMVTGKYPDAYDTAITLQKRLRANGYANAMFAGNIYLSSNFEMNRDWGLHWVENKPQADDQVARAMQWLDENEGRDSLVMLHFMDTHLDYREPASHRFEFAGVPKAGLGERFNRGNVVRAKLQNDEDKQYVIDRYDNTIHFMDAALKPLLEQFTENDIVLFFSDHGEEFWEHGGYEHGHSLYDELLRVPLAIWGKGIDTKRVETPVSLLDLTPTVLDLLDIEHEPLDGISLLSPSESRHFAYGWPLYGNDRWGVLHRNTKWTSHEGNLKKYNLDQDIAEKQSLLKDNIVLDDSAFSDGLSIATHRKSLHTIRVVNSPSQSGPAQDLVLSLTVPGGFSETWVGGDPTSQSFAEVTTNGATATVTWKKGYRGTREVYLLPVSPLFELDGPIVAKLNDNEEHQLKNIAPIRSRAQRLGTLKQNKHRVTINVALSLQPAEQATTLVGFDEEVEGMLKVLGYVD
jgi:hypothetical protein